MHAASGPIEHATTAKIAKWVCTRCSCNVSLDRRQHLTGFSRIYLETLPLKTWCFEGIDSRWYVSAIFFWNFTKLHFPEISENFRVGGFNPSEKYASQNGFIFPQIRDENKKYLSCHHPVRNHHPVSLMKNHHLGWPRAEVFFMIWSSHTEASRPFDFSSQRTGFHLWSQGWVCWLMNLSIYWFIDWFMYWFIDWLFETASSAASLWANVWLNHYLAHCKWNHDSGGASKQPNNQLEKVEVCAATFMYIYIHILYIFPWKEKMARSWILPKYNAYIKGI